MKRLLMISVLSLTTCAPVVWQREGTPPQVADMRCQLIANTATPTVDTRSPFESSSANLGHALADGLIEGWNKAENFILCMKAAGYVATRAP